MSAALPIYLFILAGISFAVVNILVGGLFAPSRRSAVKDMPYESGMDPFHDTHRRFDIRFHLVAIAFLVFDVEILFLYPWAVSMYNAEGVSGDPTISRMMVLGGALFFFAMLALGWLYDWKKGVYKWR